MDLMETKLEKKIYKEYHVFNCLENGKLAGIIILKPSSMILLKNKVCYELAIKLEYDNPMLDEFTRTNIYKIIRSREVFNGYEIIEGVARSDQFKIHLFERLGFIKTAITNKRYVYYKIK